MLNSPRLSGLLLGALALNGCTTEVTTYATIPIISSEPAVPSAIRQGKTRLMAVEKVYAWCDQGQLRLQVSASSATGGWTGADVNRLGVEGGTIIYEAVAMRPRGATDDRRVDVLTFEHREPAIRYVSRVRVLGQMNEMQADVQLPFAC